MTHKNACCHLPTCSYERFFTNFSNQNRFRIIQLLQQEPLSVSDIVAQTGQEQSAVSHNLRILQDCRIVKAEQKGKQRIYSLNENTVIPLLHIIDQHVKEYCHTNGSDVPK